jgi:hypothetical protein
MMRSATAFAAFHDHVHEFGQLDIAELGIRQDFNV